MMYPLETRFDPCRQKRGTVFFVFFSETSEERVTSQVEEVDDMRNELISGNTRAVSSSRADSKWDIKGSSALWEGQISSNVPAREFLLSSERKIALSTEKLVFDGLFDMGSKIKRL